ncbi:MAG: lactate racemase domain-containing protein [Candidatus Hodarchaeales archaeon]
MEYKKIELAYGDEIIADVIPKDMNARVLVCPPCERTFTDAGKRFDEILANPVDSPPLKELVEKRPKPQITVIVDDNTRPNKHTRILLPMIFNKLLSYGVNKKDIVIIVAAGSHDRPSAESIERKVFGSTLYREWEENIVIHEQEKNCTFLGKSALGTPVEIDNTVIEAGLVITVSDSEYHYFAGIAGTVKQLFPGCAGKETIARNHPQMFDYKHGLKPACRLGNTSGNPVIEDIIDMVKTVKEKVTIFCIDAVIEGNEIVILNAGDIISLHKLAIEFLKPIREITVEKPADLVIVSTGSLAVNLYQSGKGLHAGWNAVKQGGDVLLLAPCDQGHGNMNYYQTMKEVTGKNIEDALKWVIDNKCSIQTFKIGNQKPVDLLRILKRCDLHILTEMDKKEIEDIFRIKKVPWKDNARDSLREWIANYKQEKNPDPLVYILPEAGVLVSVKNRGN